LFTVDNVELVGISQGGSFSGGGGLVNATFAGWAADVFFELGGAIENAGTSYSPTGSVDTRSLPTIDHLVVGPAWGNNDVTTAMA